MDDDDFLRSIQQQVENEYLTKEQIYNQIRETGEEAPAKILSMMDRGVRVGDIASMLRFDLEVFPKDHPSFRADTQNAISASSLYKGAILRKLIIICVVICQLNHRMTLWKSISQPNMLILSLPRSM